MMTEAKAKVTEAQAAQAREAEAAALVVQDQQAEQTHAVATQPADETFVKTQRKRFSSIIPVDRKSKIDLYRALSGKSEKLSDHLGEKISVQHIVAEPVDILDTETGELIPQWRIILMTPDEKLFSTVATGVRSSLGTIFDIVGKPPFNPAITVIPMQETTRRGFKVIKLGLAAE